VWIGGGPGGSQGKNLAAEKAEHGNAIMIASKRPAEASARSEVNFSSLKRS